MTQSNAELIRSGYEAFAAADIAAVLALLDDKISWLVPGRNLVAGQYDGHDEVLGFFQALGDLSDGTFDVSIDALAEDGEEMVLALVTEDAERNGERLTVPAVHVWTVKEGKAVGFRAFQHDDHEMDAFWS